jgi:AraC-like DNA-binding protein
VTLLGAILWFGASQGLLLCAVILGIKTGDRTANGLLALFLGISALELGLLALSYSGVSFEAGVYRLYALAILKGPALYLYVRALTEPEFPLGRAHFIQLLWIFPNVALMWWFTRGASSGDPVRGESLLDSSDVYWYSIFLNLVVLVYAAKALAVLNQYRSRVEHMFSSVEEISLAWLKWLLVFLLTLRVGNIALDLMRALGLLPASYKSYAVALLNIGVIYFVSFGGLRQPIIFSRQFRSATGSPAQATVEASQDSDSKKYEKSGLSEARIRRIGEQLRTAMSEKQLFMDPELTLPDLAAQLAVSGNDLSRVINSQENKNFYDFVNGYRVEAASNLLRDPANNHRKMLHLAMDVGFKSQSTFYNHFKKHRGMTPSQYRAEKAGHKR